ncbi:unnamed protein product [Didymodactylos carnosus]|uniref:Protein arginine N-methyltransferase n=1 Tax=Didymodactylos carnosus TaxID=1234261 RepID=A0A8S2CP78_9BILA|nr:unnamed protein product [Didymodactylos carnosus]CAF3546203.1 unnamed protein product [Didymodactylos carnosus]
MTFISQNNVITGELEWVFLDTTKYDHEQDLARSAYADMLHDTERNVLYEKAIIKAIENLKKSNNPIHILDIGTGTGLLSMMAARALEKFQIPHDQQRITACEVDKPMAEIARECIKINSLKDRINVINKRSTELDLSNDLDNIPINMIVAEVFDTELIGEGALRTFHDASKHLMIDNKQSIIVPARGTIFIQLVQSNFLQLFHTMNDIENKSLQIPFECSNLAGNSVYDLNVNEIHEHIIPLTEPIKVFNFDFKNINNSKQYQDECIVDNIECNKSGKINTFIMWWELDMDEDGEYKLGTTPIWCTRQQPQWREHWIHGVYYPKKPLNINQGDKVSLYCYHDEYSLYFDVLPFDIKQPMNVSLFLPRLYLPSITSRSAIASFNSTYRRTKYLNALNILLEKSSDTLRCLYIGDGLLLPLLVLTMYEDVELYIVQTNKHLIRTLNQILEYNNKRCHIIDKSLTALTIEDFDQNKLDIILSEPFFSKSLLPYDNLYFYYSLQTCKKFMKSNFISMPCRAKIRCIALEFDHLHKIRLAVKKCCNFKLKPFDDKILNASKIVDDFIETQPLFEYSSKPLSNIIDLLHFDFKEDNRSSTIKQDVEISLIQNGQCNGIAVWIDFKLSDGIWLTTGCETINFNQPMQWSTYCKQGVHLLRKPINTPSSLKVSTQFDYQKGHFSFEFHENLV